MNRQLVAKKYIEYLQEGDILAVIALFSDGGMVHSPIYGIQTAKDFYEALSNDTDASKLKINGVFEEADSNRLALYFTYHWTLNNGKVVEFEVVDILVFDENDKIAELKIIYDTVVARKLVEELKP